MNIFFAAFAGFAAIRILKLYMDGISDKKLKYISNGKETEQLLSRYYSVLGLEWDQPINITVINRAYYRQLYFAIEDERAGYKPTYSLQESKAARAYLCDFCGYIGNRN